MGRYFKDIPGQQREKILRLFSSRPELFTSIGKELQEEMDHGADQATALTEVLSRHQEEIEQVMREHDLM